MPTRVLSVFSSYELLGKSLPGMAFLLGLISISPNRFSSLPARFSQNIAQSVILALAIIVAIVILGIFIGEAVHTMAVNIENTLGWVGRRYRGYTDFMSDRRIWQDRSEDKNRGDNGGPFSILPNTPDSIEDKYSERTPWGILKYNWKRNVIAWSHKRIRGFRNLLMHHRVVFVSYIFRDSDYSRYAPTIDDETLREELGYREREFVRFFGNEFQIDELKNAYPYAIGLIDEPGTSRALRFQAIYAFCRGMWVILLLMFVAYMFIIVKEINIINYNPIVAKILQPEEFDVLTILVFLSMLSFMNSSGRYKRYFVQYLVIEIFISQIWERRSADN